MERHNPKEEHEKAQARLLAVKAQAPPPAAKPPQLSVVPSSSSSSSSSPFIRITAPILGTFPIDWLSTEMFLSVIVATVSQMWDEDGNVKDEYYGIYPDISSYLRVHRDPQATSIQKLSESFNLRQVLEAGGTTITFTQRAIDNGTYRPLKA